MIYFSRMDDQQYHAPEEGTGEKFYKRSLWWVEHRGRIRRLGIGFVMGLEAVFFVAFLWVLIDTFLIHYEGERGLVRSLLTENATDTYHLSREREPEQLRVTTGARAFRSGEGRYDFLGEASNPNDRWWAQVTYRFTYGGGGATEPEMLSIYPLESVPLVTLAHESNRSVVNPTLEILDVSWQFVDAHDIPDLASWREDRERFHVLQATFDTSNVGEGEAGRSVLQIQNQSAFGYWSVPVVIVLMSGADTVGVTRTVFEGWGAGETVRREITWFGELPTVTDVELVLLPDLFSPENYLRPDEASADDARVRSEQ